MSGDPSHTSSASPEVHVTSTRTVADIVKHYLSKRHRPTKTIKEVAAELTNTHRVSGSRSALSAWSNGTQMPKSSEQVKALRLTVGCQCLEFGEEAIRHAFSKAATTGDVAKPNRRTEPKRDVALQIPARIPTSANRKPKGFIVGRGAEIEEFAAFQAGHTHSRVINIYGPGGIGKSVVFQKFIQFGEAGGSLLGYADVADLRGSEPGQPHMGAEILGTLAASIDRPELESFRIALRDYDLAEATVRSVGKFADLYGPTGWPREGLHLPGADEGASPALRAALANRIAFKNYRNRVRQTLVDAFCDGLGAIENADVGATTLLLDTYEDVGHWDEWICREVVPSLPEYVRLVILGRDHLVQANNDWVEHGDILQVQKLLELSAPDAKNYLRHYGLTDSTALQAVYRVTGGYPLLLFLVRVLASIAGGWEAIGELTSDADRDTIADGLLYRILNKVKVEGVRDTIVTCSIAPWINPEIIRELTGAGPSDARTLYEAIEAQSFVSRHPHGVVLHDKIRELLQVRLRFSDSTRFEELEGSLTAYFGRKGGVPSG
ncbi:hypothetical protein ACQPW1_22055 [Nocardia sp. CA-128927]|uniref:hypothetical protein n=1 Tax=Nocardia sp. CA-128927 TaxID=3239975 RepID=UPI003D95533F